MPIPSAVGSVVKTVTVTGCAAAPILSIVRVTTPASSLALYMVGLKPTSTTAESMKAALKSYNTCTSIHMNINCIKHTDQIKYITAIGTPDCIVTLYCVSLIIVSTWILRTIIIYDDYHSRVDLHLDLGSLWLDEL